MQKKMISSPLWIWKLSETFQYECGTTLQEYLFLSLFLSLVTAITLLSLIAHKA